MSVSPRRLPWYRPRTLWHSLMLRPRVLAGGAAGVLALALLPASLSSAFRAAIAWDVGGIVYLALAFDLMRRTSCERIRVYAARLDDGRFVILTLILLAIASSFAAIIGLLGEARDAARVVKLAALGAAAFTITISWTVTQVVFAIHYAHEHYAGASAPDDRPALDFPGEPLPDYWDFLYFSTSIGATSQTSDVAIRGRLMRRLVTTHCVIAFFFNTSVLALTINLAAGLAG